MCLSNLLSLYGVIYIPRPVLYLSTGPLLCLFILGVLFLNYWVVVSCSKMSLWSFIMVLAIKLDTLKTAG